MLNAIYYLAMFLVFLAPMGILLWNAHPALLVLELLVVFGYIVFKTFFAGARR